jgi:diacylglycerol kinase (ATP)
MERPELAVVPLRIDPVYLYVRYKACENVSIHIRPKESVWPMRYKLIVNPTSGRGSAEEAIPNLEHFFMDRELSFDLVRTTAPEHAIELARKAAEEGYEVIVAAGGDGTANEVLNGIMLAKKAGKPTPILGVIAIGRGNDFAFGFGISPGLEAGCEILARGNRQAIDVGLVKGGNFPEGRYFGNGVGIGFDAMVGFEALKMKRLQGFLSYLVAALKTIFLYYKAPLVQLEYGNQVIELHALMVSIMNGRRMGGGFMMAPEASIDDGLFDLCVAEQVSKLGVLALIPKFMAGTQAAQNSIRTDRTAEIRVTALEGSLPAHADGETLCTAGEQLSIQLLPAQMEIFTQ